MAGSKENKRQLKPLTFKIPPYMNEKIDQMIENDEYKNRAELIREAIEILINQEMKIPGLAPENWND